MDMKEASEMTEASGLVDDQGGSESSSQRAGGARTGRDARQSSQQLGSAPEPSCRLSDQLREMTVRSPLGALSMAFLLGVLVARRR